MDDSFSRDIPLWVSTFQGLPLVDDVAELCDGVLLTEVLAQISPKHFDYALTRGTSSWAGHKVNLSYLSRGLEDYYREDHAKFFAILDCVNVDRLAQEKDLGELKHLMEWIVGAAVQCRDKQRYINNIMGMSEESQQTLMNLAKAQMQRASGPPPSVSEGPEAVAGELEDERDALRGRLAAVEDEREQHFLACAQLRGEAEANAKASSVELKMRAQAFDDMQEELNRRNANLRQELDHAHERESDLRASLKGDYEQRSGKDSAKWENQIRRLEEEKDILTGKLEDFSKLKSQGERQRDKIEEMDGVCKALRDRLGVVEESNAKRLDRILELEGAEKDRDFNKKKMDQVRASRV